MQLIATTKNSYEYFRYIFIMYADFGLVENGELRLHTPKILYTILTISLFAFSFMIYPVAAVWNDYIFFSKGITGRLCLGLMVCDQVNLTRVLLYNVVLSCGPVIGCAILRFRVYIFLKSKVGEVQS